MKNMEKIFKYGVIAIHGGEIEYGTSEIAKALSVKLEAPVYINESGPHITSTLFDNDEIQKIFKKCEIIISIHGEKSKNESFVVVGGLNTEYIRKIKKTLSEAWFIEKHYSHRLRGLDKNNVCNRGLSGKGIQLEVSRKLRNELLEDIEKMEVFIKSIKKVL
jgi:phage replication-related protein YjqB (UPF0714/DUF867 family)